MVISVVLLFSEAYTMFQYVLPGYHVPFPDILKLMTSFFIKANQLIFSKVIVPFDTQLFCKLFFRMILQATQDYSKCNHLNYQKQPSRGILKKMCSENMQQIYRRTSRV